MANIPIVVVAYDRLHSLKRITDSLLQAEYPQGAELIPGVLRFYSGSGPDCRCGPLQSPAEPANGEDF